MIDLLLKYGANIDIRIDTKLGYTVLMKLASTDFVDSDRFDNIVEIIQFLIERGANKNVKGYDQRSIYEVIKNTTASVTGEIKFFGLTKTNMKLEGLEKHQMLIDSYKKLLTVRREY